MVRQISLAHETAHVVEGAARAVVKFYGHAVPVSARDRAGLPVRKCHDAIARLEILCARRRHGVARALPSVLVRENLALLAPCGFPLIRRCRGLRRGRFCFFGARSHPLGTQCQRAGFRGRRRCRVLRDSLSDVPCLEPDIGFDLFQPIQYSAERGIAQFYATADETTQP